MKKYIPFLILLVFTIIASSKLFNFQFFTTHDGSGHIIRMEEFNAALNDGQFPVRIAKRINQGLGYPYFHFNYPLIYYSGDILHRFGLGFVEAFKTIMFLSVFAGGIFIYKYTKFFFSTLASTVAGVLYIIVPYRFLNMYVRGTLGEAVGLALLPGLFFGIEYILKNRKNSIIPLLAVASLLILSHNITALIGAIIVSLYALFRVYLIKKNKVYYLLRIIKAGALSLLLTVFFWLPALLDSKLTKLSELREDYQDFFPIVRELFYSPWGFGGWKVGLFPGKMSPQIGLTHTLILIAGIVLLTVSIVIWKKRQNKELLGIFFVVMTLIMLFFSLEISKPIWDNVPVLQAIQHPWRFVGYILIPISFLGAYIFDWLKTKKLHIIGLIFLITFLMYANRNHIRVNMYFDYVSPFADGDFVYSLSTTSKDEHMPRYAPRVFDTPDQMGEVFPEDSGTSKRLVWKSNYHKFDVDLKAPAEFRDNTSYFPGWIAKIDGKNVEILYEKDQFKRLRVKVPKGKHKIEFFFVEPPLRKVVNTVSLATLIFLAMFWIRKKFRPNK